MSKKMTGKRLNESQRCEIIAKLSKTDAPSKRAIAREYDVSEGAIRKMWDKREQILERSALMSDEAKEKTFRSSVGRYIELEEMLYIWIDSMRRANLPVPPSLAIVKAKSLASSLSIPENDFKASWQWLSRFRARRGLQNTLLHGEGAEVSKSNPGNVYNMDKIGLSFRLLPRCSLLMPGEILGTMKFAEENLDDDNDDNILTSQASGSGLGNTVEFKGFESLYKQVVDIEDQLLCPEVREEAEETFDDLRKLFESFRSKVWAITLKAKRKKLQNLRQMTIHDKLN